MLPNPGDAQEFSDERDQTVTHAGVEHRFVSRRQDNSVAVGSLTGQSQRFRILRPLEGGRGGMGVIAIAEDDEVGRCVAIKQIRPDRVDSEMIRRKFLMEAEVTGNLEHPGVVPVYGIGTGPDGQPYYAMRLVKGEHFGVAIDKFHASLGKGGVGFGSVEFRKLIDQLIHVSMAVDYAHSRGVIHRDLKPSNILLGEFGETLVIDWGLARVRDRSPQDSSGKPTSDMPSIPQVLRQRTAEAMEATRHGTILGTLGYAAPEQLSHDCGEVGERSDIYSLGAVLYEILTGTTTVQTRDKRIDQIVEEVVRGAIIAPRSRNRDVPKSLDAICRKAISTAPHDRYESPRALVDDLEHWKADLPVAARPDSWIEHLARFARRHRTLARSGLAGLLLFSIGTATAAFMIDAQRKAADLARREAQSAEARTRRVLEYLVSAFRKPDPAVDGREVRVADVLAQARGDLNAKLGDAPRERGALLQAIAKTYQGLGLYQLSVEAHAEAYAIRTATLGAKHHESLVSATELGEAHAYAGQPELAVPLYELAINGFRTQRPPGDPELLAAMAGLAYCYGAIGDMPKALPLLQAAAESLETTLGPEHTDTLAAKNNLAYAHNGLGNREQAKQLYESILATRRKVLGPAHPDTLLSMNNVGSCYEDLGEYEKAIELHTSAWTLRSGELGADHPDTLVSRGNLAGALLATSRFAEALTIMMDVCPKMEAALGANHPHVAQSLRLKAEALLGVGKHTEALETCEIALERRTALDGPDAYETLAVLFDKARILHGLGRDDECVALVTDFLDRKRSALKSDGKALAAELTKGAELLREAGRVEQSEALTREALALSSAKETSEPSSGSN